MSDPLLMKKTLVRLKQHPRTLAQTILAQTAVVADTHVNQALDLIEHQQNQTSVATQLVDPDPETIGDLGSTKVVRAYWIDCWEFEGKKVEWNTLFKKFLLLVWKKQQLSSVKQLHALCGNFTTGKLNDTRTNYMDIPKLGISVKRTDANAIAQAIVKASKKLGWHCDLVLEAKSKKCKSISVGEQMRITVGSVAKKLKLVG